MQFRKKESKFVVLLGDYNNKNDQLDDGQMIRNVEKVRAKPSEQTKNNFCRS